MTAWSPELEQKMRADWDARARENAFHYIASSRRDWTVEEFFATGREVVLELIVRDLDAVAQGRRLSRMRALEIGCGAGRITRALAELFGDVHGVDVSGEMIERGRELLADIPNAHLHHGSGVDLAVLGDLEFDFAFSFIVFQHIPSRDVIANYVRETARRLRPGGVFKFQVQGYPVEAAPDDTWLGAWFNETEARRTVLRTGLQLFRVQGAGSQYFWLWARKPTRGLFALERCC